MKALSMTQPWATLVALGLKGVETRSWPTSYRGDLAIHAAKGYPGWAREFADELCHDGTIDGTTPDFPLPRGQIIAMVTLGRCFKSEDMIENIPLERQPTEERFGDFSPGRYGWRFDRGQRLATPIPARGALGLWTVPDDIAAAVIHQLRESEAFPEYHHAD